LYYFLLRINLTFIISFFIIFIGFFTRCLLCYSRIIYNILLLTLAIIIVRYCFMGSISLCSCTDCYDDAFVFVQNFAKFKEYLHRIIYISAFIFHNILYLYFLIYFIPNISYSYYLYYMPNILKIVKIIILLHLKTY
jgi:hypothetical protein